MIEKFNIQFFGEEGAAGAEPAAEPANPVDGAEPTDAAKTVETPPEEESLLSQAGSKQEGEGKFDEGEADDPAPLVADNLVMPEGMEYDQELGDKFLAAMNDSALSSVDRANKLIGLLQERDAKLFASLQAAETANAEAVAKSITETNAAWAKASMDDPEFGGANWEASQAVIYRGREHLGSPELTELINDGGFGNHPALLRMFYKAGKMLGEDGGAGEGRANAEASASRANRMFGKSLEGINIKGADD